MSEKTHTQHILPLKLYLGIGSTLLVLTVVTVLVAQIDLGAINLLVAMAIAAVKGTLVALYFMHLKYTNKLYAMVLIISLAMVAIFIILTMVDTLARDQVDPIRAVRVQEKAIIYRSDTITDSLLDSTTVLTPDTTAVDSIQ